MPSITLRDYQSRAVGQLHESLARHRSVLYTLPTGGGKTVVFGHLARLCAEHGTRIGILVHRDTLLEQACAKLRDFGVNHSVVAPGRTDFGDLVKVASVSTLVRRLDRHDFDFLVIDEAHHAVAGSYRRIMDHYGQASILGVTATPQRLDGRGLGEAFDSLVLGPSVRDLVDQGYLTDAVVYGPQHAVDLASARTVGGDYNAADLQEIMDRNEVTGDAVKHYRELCPGAPAVAFCVSVRHAVDVAGKFAAAGYRAASVDGGMSLRTIRAATDALRAGQLDMLASCDLISEGFDAPGVVAAIMLRPTKSLGVYMQQVGRTLRPVDAPTQPDAAGRLAAIAASRKPRAVVLDHAGNFLRFGLVDEPREWTLDSRRKRPGAPAVSVKQCPACYGMCKAHVRACPWCRFVFTVADMPREVQQVDGKLARVDKEAMARLRHGEERAARTYRELVELGIRRGYAPQWAYRKWLQRGGDPARARL